MRLRVLTPSEVVFDREVDRVGAHGSHGHFTLLPRHVDFAAILRPGLMTCCSEEGEEEILALDEGVLVKVGSRVTAAVRSGVAGVALEDLRRAVGESLLEVDERERRARAALSLLEADLLRRFLELR